MMFVHYVPLLETKGIIISKTNLLYDFYAHTIEFLSNKPVISLEIKQISMTE